MSRTLHGIIPIVATPFQPGGALDLDSQARLVDHLLDEGAHGLALFGNAAEGYTLLPDERITLMDLIVKRVAGRAPTVVGVGETGTEAAVAQCRQAESQGASALMVLPPYYMRPDGDGLMHFFGRISDAVSIPIMIQDAPMLTQVSMPPALLARMAKEIEHVQYAKVEAPPTAPKVSKVVDATGGALTILGGINGQFMIEEIQRGARGQMPAADMTRNFVEVWNRLESADSQGAWDLFARALPLIRFEVQPGLAVSAVKHNLLDKGVIHSAEVRHPTSSLDAAGLDELKVLRERLGG